MKYDDLLNIPFKLNGRDRDGMDCYGLCIEMCRRAGTPLRDLNLIHVSEEKLPEEVMKVNVVEVPEDRAREGDLVQCVWNNELHIAYMITKKTVIHATTGGVRISPVISLQNRKFFKVTK